MVPAPSSNWRIAYACLAVRIGESLTYALNTTPILRLLEANVCRNHYRQHDVGVIDSNDNVSENLCKIAEVQGMVSHINGLNVILSLVPSVLAALPYVSQRRLTRKDRTLLLNVFGSLLTNGYNVIVLYFYNFFDPRWIWLQGMFSFIAGGDLVFYSLLQALIAESIDHNALSSFYIYSSSLALVVRVVGSATSLLLMKTSLWTPVFLSILTKAFAVPLILVFLKDLSHSHMDLRSRDIPLMSSDDPEPPTEDLSLTKGEISQSSFMWQTLREQHAIIRQYLFPLTMFALQEIGNSMRVILPYWLSRRYQWTLRDTGWVTLGISLLNALIISLTPRLSKYLHRQHGSRSSKDKDLHLAKMCLGFATVGALLLGFSWHPFSAVVSLAVIAAGTAFRDAYTSFMTADMQKEEISQVFVVLETVSLGAFSLGSWVLSDLYAVCLEAGVPWLTGVPVWLCVLPFAACWYYLR